MDYRTFHERFGGSFRTKHLAPPDWGQWIARRLRKGGRKRVRGRVRNRVPWALPTHSGLPHEFIRLDPWEAEYLFMVASLAEAGIVEIGRYRGGSSFLLACANERRPIYSIDRDPQDDALVQRLLDGTRQHAARREHEMRDARGFLDDLGTPTWMTDGTLAWLHSLATAGS